MQAQAGIVEPIYKQLKDPSTGSAHTDSLLFKFGRQKNENTNFNVIYDPLKNNNIEISYLKNYDNFNLKVKSNYAMYSKIPDYGAGIELSATF